jgi:hypothetical protein
MKTSPSESPDAARQPRGVAGLFDEFERKALFKKYLIFLGWIEVGVFASCWLFNIGSQGYDRNGPVESPFPWREYFLIAFVAPIAITFLIGLITIGFNKYFGEEKASDEGGDASGAAASGAEASGKAHKALFVMGILRKLPFLATLLLLCMGAGIVYNLNGILRLIGTVGEKSVKILLMGATGLLAVAAVFALILIVMNYKLRKRSMEYQYRSEVAERFGLIILEDNTVMNGQGKLLVQGKKMKDAVPLLTAEVAEPEAEPETSREPGAATARVDFSASS